MGLGPWPDTDHSTITFHQSSSTLFFIYDIFSCLLRTFIYNLFFLCLGFLLSSFTILFFRLRISLLSLFTIFFFTAYVSHLSSFTIFSSSVSVSHLSSFTIFYSLFLCFSPFFIYNLFFRLRLIFLFIYNLSFCVSVSHQPLFTIFFPSVPHHISIYDLFSPCLSVFRLMFPHLEYQCLPSVPAVPSPPP